MSDERIDRLERELGRVKVRLRVAFAAAVLGLAVGVIGLSTHWLPLKSVRTAKLELVDALGRTRATLESEEQGPALTMMAADEAPRVRLSVAGQLGTLSLLDPNGDQRLGLTGAPGVLLSDSTRARLALEVGVDGPALELVDPRGFATLHPVDGFKLFGPAGALSSVLAPGNLSLYSASTGPDAKLSVSLTAPRQPGDRARLLLYEDGQVPSFTAP